MKRALVLMGVVGALTGMAFAADASKVMDSAAQVVESMASSKQIPHSLLHRSKCVAVIPSLTKAGFIVGGEHGNGVISCRTSSGWSAPAFITMSGGSIGLQAGGEHKDIVLLMNEQGEQMLNSGHWDLGAEAVAAGPSGESVGGAEDTGWGKTPVLSYSRSSGAYAGADVGGSKLDADKDTMHNLYGKDATMQSVLSGKTETPESAHHFVAALEGAAGK